MLDPKVRHAFEVEILKTAENESFIKRYSAKHPVPELRGAYCRSAVELMWYGYQMCFNNLTPQQQKEMS